MPRLVARTRRIVRRVVAVAIGVGTTAAGAWVLSKDDQIVEPIVVERFDWRSRTVVRVACIPETTDATDRSLPPLCAEAS